jgi:drug/metabolite transporter superfamily protein YnfA
LLVLLAALADIFAANLLWLLLRAAASADIGGSGFELLLGLYNEGEMVAKGCRSLQQQTTTIATVVLL